MKTRAISQIIEDQNDAAECYRLARLHIDAGQFITAEMYRETAERFARRARFHLLRQAA